MSGAMIPCCRVCGGPLRTWSDVEEGRVLEREESCPQCNLYSYEFHYGHTEECVGVICARWDYDQDGPADWRERFAEARRVWASDDGRAHAAAVRGQPTEETPRLLMADWCDDNDCPLSAAYLRAWADTVVTGEDDG